MPRIVDNRYVAELGKLFRLYRESIGISREALAVKIGTKYETIRMYEDGQCVMKVDRLFQILQALNISVQDCLSIIFDNRNSQTLKLLAKINSLDEASYQRIIRQMDALIDIEKNGIS